MDERHRWNSMGGGPKKRLVESCLRIDAKWLQHETPALGDEPCWGIAYWDDGNGELAAKVLVLGLGDGKGVCLRVQGGMHGDDRFGRDHVPITYTHGGLQAWFLCPGHGCGRRVRFLYLPLDGHLMLCRHCHWLTYRSQQTSNKSKVRFLRKFGLGNLTGETWRLPQNSPYWTDVKQCQPG